MNDTDPQSRPGPNIIPRTAHSISRANISQSALKVLYRLDKAGYQAFLVGGGVRDLLLGLEPKDFDVATDAHPDQVRELFRNSRLIGRRFKLAHVRFGREIVEVVTFRGAASDIDDDHQQADSGRILRDNVYGNIDEDVWRRDFTVNALYYNIADFSIWDYATGIDDVNARVLRLIGDPERRYREDPVRMLRAVRLAAKLRFTLAPETAAPIAKLGGLLREVPPARLFDETLKLFQSGHALRSFELLSAHDLLRYLFPFTASALADDRDGGVRRFIEAGLENTDRRIDDDKSVTPMFLYAVMLWHAIRSRANTLAAEQGLRDIEAMLCAHDEIVAQQQHYTAFPKRFSLPMKDVLVMQERFTNRRGAKALRLLEHGRFRAAYDFLELRAKCGDAEPELAQWWSDAQNLSAAEKQQTFQVRRARRKRSRRPRRRASPQPSSGA